jgi:hypothetical protein
VTLAELLRPHATVTVVGLAKNAGKTTVVNHLLERMCDRVGLASLGLDGEARDQLTGGYDAGFGPGSTPSTVAGWIAQELVARKRPV